MTQKNPIIVYIETDENNEILPVSLEAIHAGKVLSQKKQGTLIAVIIGNNLEKVSSDLLHFGIDTIYCADHPELQSYEPECFLPVLSDICKKENPFGVIFANTFIALDLASRLSSELDTGLINDCVKIILEEGELLCTKAVFSNNVMAEYSFATTPGIVTLRARSFEASEKTETSSGELIRVEYQPGSISKRIKLVERTLDEQDGIKLGSADIVVSGGRGMGGEEGFDHLKELCGTLGAALGASRPPCDLEWTPAKTQVGLTGEIIAPALYIAVGISGSFQHISGMSDSNVIVAINRDERANIFKIADYGIVGEYEDILPEFNKTLKDIL